MESDPNLMDKCFVLIDDIDLGPDLPGGQVFNRALIAPAINDARGQFQGVPFSGRFDGNGHVISRLSIDGEDYLGLFGYCDAGAVISDLFLEAADVNGAWSIGALVGENRGASLDRRSGGE